MGVNRVPGGGTVAPGTPSPSGSTSLPASPRSAARHSGGLEGLADRPGKLQGANSMAPRTAPGSMKGTPAQGSAGSAKTYEHYMGELEGLKVEPPAKGSYGDYMNQLSGLTVELPAKTSPAASLKPPGGPKTEPLPAKGSYGDYMSQLSSLTAEPPAKSSPAATLKPPGGLKTESPPAKGSYGDYMNQFSGLTVEPPAQSSSAATPKPPGGPKTEPLPTKGSYGDYMNQFSGLTVEPPAQSSSAATPKPPGGPKIESPPAKGSQAAQAAEVAAAGPDRAQGRLATPRRNIMGQLGSLFTKASWGGLDAIQSGLNRFLRAVWTATR